MAKRSFQILFCCFFSAGGAPSPSPEGRQKNQTIVSPTRAKNGVLHKIMFKMAQIELTMELKWLRIDYG